MAESLTYTSLLADIQEYAERDDDPFVAQIPRLIMQAENRLAREAKQLGAQRYVTGTLNGNTLAKPERWNETLSFSITTVSGTLFLKYRTLEYLRVYWPDASVTSTPAFYADYGYEHFLIAPTPDDTYAFQLAYYERPDPLDSVNGTNWYTQYAPDVLLNACMVEAQTFLKRPELLQMWLSQYDRSLQSLIGTSVERKSGDRSGMNRDKE